MTPPAPRPTVRWVDHGDDALATLAAEIAAAKDPDPLRRVTVIVPTKVAGLVLRRQLAAREPGIVGVQFDVIEQTAEALAAPGLAAAGSQALDDRTFAVVLAEVARQRPGALGKLVEHPATLDALARAVSNLRAVPDPQRARLLAGLDEIDSDTPGVHAALADIAEHFDRRVDGRFHDVHDLLRTAARTDPDQVRAMVGNVIVHLPTTTTPARTGFIQHLAACGPTTVVVGRTRNRRADRWVVGNLAKVVGERPQASQPRGRADTGAGADVRGIVVSDAEEEVRQVARHVAAAMHAGRALARIQVLYLHPEPYESLVHEMFALHGLPHNGPATVTLGHTIAGRALREAWAWHDDGHPREALLDLVSTLPVRHAGSRVRAPRWAEAARKAGVIGGLGQWESRLLGHARDLEHQAPGAPEWLRPRLEREAATSRDVHDFATALAEALDRPEAATWRTWSTWALALLDHLFGRGRNDWPERDRIAEGELRQHLAALADLDEVAGDGAAPVVPWWEFRRMVDEVLQARTGRVGTVGTGAYVGPLQTAGHVAADEAFVLGAIEGALPPRPGRDPLLDDDTITAISSSTATTGLASGHDRVEQLHHAFRRVLASSTTTTLLVPRIDRRAQRPARPGPWVLDVLGDDTPVTVDDVLQADNADDLPLEHVPSAVAGLMTARTPAGPGEWRRRALTATAHGGHDVVTHPLARSSPRLVTAAHVVRARNGDSLTAWDGHVPELADELADLAGRPQSPNALATYATCPRRWLFEHGLRIRTTEEPRLSHDITPLDRGNLVHATLEAWVRERPTDETGDDGRERLRVTYDVMADELERTGRIGAAGWWDLERSRIWQHLEDWHAQHEDLVGRGWEPVEVEWSFGRGDDDPMEVVADNGLAFRLRGQVDRVDRHADGGVAVWDYKTGKPSTYRGLDDDIALGGRELQLPVYALAATRDRDATTVQVGYWHIHENAPSQPRSVVVDQAARDRIQEVFDTIAAGLASGVLMANPGDETFWPSMHHEHCRFCPFDRVCPSHGQRRKAADSDWSTPQAQVLAPLADSHVLARQDEA